jgi:hypothetical protein
MAPAFFTGYSHPMNNKKYFLKTNKVGLVLGAALLVTLTECVGHAGGLNIGIGVAPVVVVAPPVVIAPPIVVAPAVVVAPPVVIAPPIVVAPAVVVQDDYVYYPSYGVYYNSSRHQYAYLEGGAWVSAPAPSGVSVDVLLASPSVRMDFHDSPEKHHADMIRKYPRNWAPPGSDHDLKKN